MSENVKILIENKKKYDITKNYNEGNIIYAD